MRCDRLWGMNAEKAIKRRFELVSGELNERTRRLVAVSEAMGWGGISAVSRATGISRKAISHGIKELQERRGTIIMENAQEFIERKEVEFQHDRVRTMKDSAGNAYVWNREAWTLMMQSDYPKKVFVVERFRRDGDVQYRFSFYGAKEGRWVWSRSCPLIPVADFQPLLDKARSEGTIV